MNYYGKEERGGEMGEMAGGGGGGSDYVPNLTMPLLLSVKMKYCPNNFPNVCVFMALAAKNPNSRDRLHQLTCLTPFYAPFQIKPEP